MPLESERKACRETATVLRVGVHGMAAILGIIMGTDHRMTVKLFVRVRLKRYMTVRKRSHSHILVETLSKKSRHTDTIEHTHPPACDFHTD